MMEQTNEIELKENLALALIYLSSWKEDEVLRAWKGYDFAMLDQMQEKGLIHFSKTAKSLYFTDEGCKKAEEAVEKFKATL